MTSNNTTQTHAKTDLCRTLRFSNCLFGRVKTETDCDNIEDVPKKKKCLCAWQAMIRYHSSSNTSLFLLNEEREHRCLHFMDNLCACFRFSTINSETFWLERYPRLLNNKVICITVWFDMNGGIILEYVLSGDARFFEIRNLSGRKLW